MTYSEIYNICMPLSKRKEERLNLWVYIAIRPLSILFTIPFIGTKIQPTTITKWSIISLIVGFGFFCFAPNVLFLLIGWFFFFVWAVLDGVDGNFARCSNQCSSLGDLWDTMGGYAAMIFIYMSAGIASYYHPEIIPFENKILILILGCATATLSIFPRLMMHKRRSSNYKDDIVKSLSDKESYSLSKVATMNLISPSGFMQIIFLVSIIFNLLNLFVAVYFFINLGVTLISLRQLLR